MAASPIIKSGPNKCKSLDRLWHGDENEKADILRMYHRRDKYGIAFKQWLEDHGSEILNYHLNRANKLILPVSDKFYGGISLREISRIDEDYFFHLISNWPWEETKEELNLWKLECLSPHRSYVPCGRYMGQTYDTIALIDSNYIHVILTNNLPILSLHIKSWFDKNQKWFEQLYEGSDPEKICCRILDKLGIKYEREFPIVELENGKMRFDFKFHYWNKIVILEYDGNQHFEFPNKYHKTQEEFEAAKESDAKKMIWIDEKGWSHIRICGSFHELGYHIVNALNEFVRASHMPKLGYFSDHKRYGKMTSMIDELKQKI